MSFKFLWWIVAFGFVVNSYGRTFYISSLGSDSNPGVSPEKPWKTIGRLNRAISESEFVRGDSALFKRGEYFTGRIFSERLQSSSTVTCFGAYGIESDPLPTIRGSELIEGWRDTVVAGKPVYVADLTHLKKRIVSSTFRAASYFGDSVEQHPGQMFFDTKRQTIARYPDREFLFIDADGSDSTIYDTELSGINNPGVWIGATMVVRTIQWRYNHRRIVSLNPSAGSLTCFGGKSTGKGWGYYLQNSIGALSSANEWFYDSSSALLFFIPPHNIRASELKQRVGVSVYRQAIQVDQGYIVENLHFTEYVNAAIVLKTDSRNSSVRNCAITNSGIAISGTRVSNATIIGCKLDSLFSEGMQFWNCGQLTIADNRIGSVGLDPGVEGWYFGISLGGSLDKMPQFNTRHSIKGNYIHNTGYSAITHTTGDGQPGNGSVIEYNLIDSVCMTVGDGGGIYAGYTNADTIRYNVIQNGYGNSGSWNFGQGGYRGDRYVFGINLMGDQEKLPAAQNSHYHNNVVCNFEAAFFCNRDIVNNLVENNIFYNSRRSDILLKRRSEGNKQNRFLRNTMFSFATDLPNITIDHLDQARDESAIGVFDNNYYGNPFNIRKEPVLSQGSSDTLGSQYYSLKTWSADYKQERSEYRASPFLTVYNDIGTFFLVEDTLSGNLLGNSTFEDSTGQWQSQAGSITRQYSASLKSTVLAFNNDTSAYFTRLISPGPQNLSPQSFYRLRFRMSSIASQRVTVFVSDRNSPFGDGDIKSESFSFLSTPYGNSYDFIFKISSAGSNLRLNWRLQKQQSGIMIDDISLQEVSVIKYPNRLTYAPLFVNTSKRDSIIEFPSGYTTIEGSDIASPLRLPSFTGTILLSGNPLSAENNRNSMTPAMRSPKAHFNVKRNTVFIRDLPPSNKPVSISVYTLDGKTVLHQKVEQVYDMVLPIKLKNRIASRLLIIDIRGEHGVYYKTATPVAGH